MTVADTLAAVKEEWWRQVIGITDWIQGHYPNEACDHDFFEGKWDTSVLDDFARYRQVLIDIHDFMTCVLRTHIPCSFRAVPTGGNQTLISILGIS